MSDEIRIIRTLPARAERVVECWLSPTTLVAPVTRVEMDPVVGGPVRMWSGDDAAQLRGVFVQVDRPHRLAYTWRWEPDGTETLVDVTFHPAGPATVVELTHAGFDDEADRERHRAGWQSYLDGLAPYL